MADVFISYKHEDRDSAERLDRALLSHGFSTWWDTSLVAGEVWSDTIRSELSIANAVIVLWSTSSWRSQWVQAEAHAAFNRNALISVRLDDVPIGVPFNIGQAVDLRSFDGAIASIVEGMRRRLPERRPTLSAPRGSVTSTVRWKASPKRITALERVVDFETFRLHNGCRATISTDMSSVAVVPFREVAKVWDVRSKTARVDCRSFHDGVRCIGFADAGTRVIALGHDDFLRVYDLATGQELARSEFASIPDWKAKSVFSPDGARLIFSEESSAPVIYDIASGERLWAAEANAQALVTDETGFKIALAFDARTLTVVDIREPGKRRVVFETGEDFLFDEYYCVRAANRTLSQILVAAGDGSLLVDTETCRARRLNVRPSAAAISDDGAVVIAADYFGLIQVFDADHGDPMCGTLARLRDANRMNKAEALALSNDLEDALSVDEFGIVTSWRLVAE